jgi:peptidoglycan hydrolase-like protein with peptidoglycan-binding domain
VEHWFQNTRGLVIVVLAVVTCAVLLAVEPGDGFPSGSGSASSSDNGELPPVTTPGSTQPGSPTTSTLALPTLSVGTTDHANTTVLQQKLIALGYTSVTADGDFGPTTEAAVKQFQTDHGISPADGVVNQATWNALNAPPTTTTTKAA